MNKKQLIAISKSYSRMNAKRIDEELQKARLGLIYQHQTQYKTKQEALKHTNPKKYQAMLQEAYIWAIERAVQLHNAKNVSQCKIEEVEQLLNDISFHSAKLKKLSN